MWEEDEGFDVNISICEFLFENLLSNLIVCNGISCINSASCSSISMSL